MTCAGFKRLKRYLEEFDRIVNEYDVPNDVADLAKSYFTHVILLNWEDIVDFVKRTRKHLAIACVLLASDELGAPISLKKFRVRQRCTIRLMNILRRILNLNGDGGVEKYVKYISRKLEFDDFEASVAEEIAKALSEADADYRVAIYATYVVARRKGISATEFAKKVGISDSTLRLIVSRMEGKRYKRAEPKYEYAKKRGGG